MDKAKCKKKLPVMSYRGVILLFIIILLLAAVFSFQYYKHLNETIHAESKGYLREVSGRIGTNIDRIIDDNYAILYSMASVIDTAGEASLDDIRPTLRSQQNHWNFQKIMLIDSDGKAYGLDNQEVFLNIDSDMNQDILDKKKTMSTAQIINNQEYIIFCVPLIDAVIDGKTFVALAASYDPMSFDKVLSMSSFDAKAYSQIITKSGTVVTRSSSEFAIKTGYNIFTSLESVSLDNSNWDRVKLEIVNDQANQVSFNIEGSSWYMVYTPIQPEEWYLLTFVPSKVVNERSDLLLQSTLIICALITVIFSALIAGLVNLFNTNRRKLERMAYVDEITGGNTIQRFYELAREFIDDPANGKYALIYTNMEKFKVLNEQIGRQNCDMILLHFYKYISATLSDKECMGRMSADNFCLLVQYKDETDLLERFNCWYIAAEKYVVDGSMQWNLPVTEFGIYVIDNIDLPFPQMIDRAKLALRESTWIIDSKMRYAFYDDDVRRQMLREKHLEDMMERALNQHEFQVYLQPKNRLPDERIGGAEALVRWDSVTEGMIYPNEFIPLFEKNGFIIQIDLYVFEGVCQTLQSWEKRGLPLVKISVNCSRIHFKNPAFLAPYVCIAAKYGIDRKYVEIELTESVVLEDTEKLTRIIDEIHEAGFGCSMDDFGSGYSSLNLLQNIPVDTLKIDGIFFRSINSSRTEAVVRSIITMAKSLSMATVAEGVEYREQVEMLKRAGCDYIQGYVFAKPMKISAFEEYAFDSEK